MTCNCYPPTLIIDIVGMVMIVLGGFGLGWYWRRPPIFGRIVGVAGRSCNDGSTQ